LRWPEPSRPAFRHGKGQLELLFVDGHAGVSKLVAYFRLLSVNHSLQAVNYGLQWSGGPRPEICDV
jgi:prepilin-type processing-associated H-X9-DG protein